MRILALLLGFLLQGVSLVDMSGLVFCSHHDGRILLEIAGALCCDPGCDPDSVRQTTPSQPSLCAGDICDDQRVSFSSPQIPPSRGLLLLSAPCGFESSPTLGHSIPFGTREPARLGVDFGASIAASAFDRVRTVALRC